MILHKTWWGEEFVSALEAFMEPGRLQRGRAYRSDHRVLAFNISGGEIKATIRGNVNPYFGVTKEPKYQVVLKFNKITPQQWQKIIKIISGNALWLSKLMLNEIPANIASAFGNEALLPTSYQDIAASCSCPDYANPCKHIAGVYYKVANILDSDPMLLFQLRGLAPEKLHLELKKTELGKAFSEHLTMPENIEMLYQQHRFSPLLTSQNSPASTKRALTQAAPMQFWSMAGGTANSAGNSWPESDQNTDSADQSHIAAALIKKQGDYPEFWHNSNSFIDAMEQFYQHTRNKNKKNLF